MTKYLDLDDPEALDVVVATLLSGGSVVVPTDTVYGLAAMPSSLTAVERLYVLKDRPPTVPIAMLVASTDQAEDLFEPAAAVPRLARAFWPGPLTIVALRRDGGGTVGVRCPDHDFLRAVAGRVGPLAVTSANRHGHPTPPTAREAAAELAGAVAVVVDGGRCTGLPSTVVDVTQPDLAIIREGSITEEQVRAAALR